MLVLLSRYEPADAVRPQDGVRSEACDEEDREDQQPVDALHRDAGEWAEAVCIRHVFVRADFKPLSTKTNDQKIKQAGYTGIINHTKNTNKPHKNKHVFYFVHIESISFCHKNLPQTTQIILQTLKDPVQCCGGF